jgi:hypothetical protein
VDGRLTLEEFSDRIGLTQRARTQQELATLTQDLPSSALAASGPGRARHRAVGSRLVRRGSWDLASGTSFQSIFGTIDLDLRQVRLPGGEVEIEIFNFFGTVTVIVPEGIVVNVDGGGLFASQVIDSPSAPVIPDAPQLRIRLRGPGGTLYVRTHEPRRGLARLLGGCA